MRIIFTFAVAWFTVVSLAPAQPKLGPSPLEQIDRMEKRLVAAPDDVQARVNLLRLYYSKPAGLSSEKIQDARRRHIVWLIENHPDMPELGQPFGSLDPTNL